MTVRDVERETIENFVRGASAQGCFQGRVLDYGSGRQPYRRLVEAVCERYQPHDRMHYPASTVQTDVGVDDPLAERGKWNAILCTQVIQYVPDPRALVLRFHWALAHGCFLVMTGPTNWPVVEMTDLWRFTPTGVVALLGRKLWAEVHVEERGHVEFEGERWPLGWQAIARKV